MSAKFISGCLVIALFLIGCSPSVEQAKLPVPANIKQDSSPAARIKYQPVSLPAPAGWVLYKFPDDPDSSVLLCAGFSEREWQVSSEGEGIKISPYRGGVVQDPLPFNIQPQDAAKGLAGDRHVKRINDGWLVGFDAGEFGGALWWFSADGSKRRKLAEDNVAGVADSSSGVLALVGLAHMGTDYGKVLLVREGQEGDRPVEAIADLGSAPTAFAMESADSLIVATYDKIVKVMISGEVEQLLAPKEGFPYPNSLTLSKAGVIHVGMRHFILRLSPAGEGYKEEWFVPSDCNKFKVVGFPCNGLRMCALADAK
jgi:hypothetical protein